MVGKSLRKALRKFFRLRRVNSESRVNLERVASSMSSSHHITSSAGNLHSVLARTTSNGSPQVENAIHDYQDTDRDEVEPPYDEVAEKLNATRSIKMAQQAVWYWGPINAAVAETVLEQEPDGTFLVRDSTDCNFLFSLSCKYDGKVGHIRIEYTRGLFMFRKILHYGADNIREFIETAVEHSKTGKMHFMTRPRNGTAATRILLLFPLSRRRTVQSLQHLSRFVILQQVRRDDVVGLPIPLGLKKYLRQAQYFVEFPSAS